MDGPKNGTDCDDGNLCNGVNTCQSGACTQTTSPVSCNSAPTCKSTTGATCNSATGACSYPNRSNGSSCDDGNLCNGVNTCQSGTCTQTTSPVSCNTALTCKSTTGATCNSATGTCSYPDVSNGISCDDGNLCNGVNTCQSGTCTQTTSPVSCNTPPACHTALGATCSGATGTCSYPAVSDGASCGTNGICVGGTCTPACNIGGTIYTQNQTNPSNSCQICRPLNSTTAWSSVADDTGCGPAKACCGGSCVSLTGQFDCGSCGNRCLGGEICDPTLLLCIPDCNPICP